MCIRLKHVNLASLGTLFLLLCYRAECQSTGDLRLISNSGFTSLFSGRLEVYYSGQWGTVCDDSFNSAAADVACEQLGFVRASNFGSVGSLGFSQGTGPIWLDQVFCFGFESRLEFCSRNSYGNHDCSHSEDIALTCTFTSAPSTPSSGISSSSILSIVLGVTIGGTVFVIFTIFVCIACCLCCAFKCSKRATNRANITAPPSARPVVLTTTTYDAHQVDPNYSRNPQAPPEAYPPQPPNAYPPQPSSAYPPQPSAAYPPQPPNSYPPEPPNAYPPQPPNAYPPQPPGAFTTIHQPVNPNFSDNNAPPSYVECVTGGAPSAPPQLPTAPYPGYPVGEPAQ